MATPNWSLSENGDSVRVVPADLPAIANEDAYAVDLDEHTLQLMLSSVRARTLGLDDVTGGL